MGANDLVALSNGDNGSSFRFFSDFSCTTEGQSISGTGVVESINRNIVRVTLSDDEQIDVLLGSCTNILVLNNDTPNLGTRVYWRGVQITSEVAQAFSMLFF